MYLLLVAPKAASSRAWDRAVEEFAISHSVRKGRDYFGIRALTAEGETVRVNGAMESLEEALLKGTEEWRIPVRMWRLYEPPRSVALYGKPRSPADKANRRLRRKALAHIEYYQAWGIRMDNDQLRHYSNKLAYEIDSWDLKVAIETGERVVVIDTRSPDAFSKEHIPGAVSLPHRTMTEATTAVFDKNALFVTYCDGIGCNASTKGALNLTRLGFRVKELMGGLDWWKRDGHPTEGSASGPGSSPNCDCE